MTLLDDIAAEHAQLTEDLDSFVSQLADEAKISVEMIGRCAPALFAFVGTEVRAYPLAWRNAWERDKVLAAVAHELAPDSPSATILVSTYLFNNARAVILSIRSPEGGKAFVMPYTQEGSELTWNKPYFAAKPLDLIHLPLPCPN